MDDMQAAALRRARRERRGLQMPATRVMPGVGQMMRAQDRWAAQQQHGVEALAAWRERRSGAEWTFAPSTGNLTHLS